MKTTFWKLWNFAVILHRHKKLLNSTKIIKITERFEVYPLSLLNNKVIVVVVVVWLDYHRTKREKGKERESMNKKAIEILHVFSTLTSKCNFIVHLSKLSNNQITKGQNVRRGYHMPTQIKLIQDCFILSLIFFLDPLRRLRSQSFNLSLESK
jgi:hypothetical protein